jgi:hypothetical protein
VFGLFSQTRELSNAQLRAGSGRTIAGFVAILVATRLRQNRLLRRPTPMAVGVGNRPLTIRDFCYGSITNPTAASTEPRPR